MSGNIPPFPVDCFSERGGQVSTPETGLTFPSRIAPTAHWSWQDAALCPVSAFSFNVSGTPEIFLKILYLIFFRIELKD